MKFTIVATVLATVAAATPGELYGRTGRCGNNCARDVKAGNLPAASQAAHVGDCKAYFQITTTPAAVTVYYTQTIPNYASGCNGVSAYSTACGCVGVVPSTFEAATPTVTATVYA